MQRGYRKDVRDVRTRHRTSERMRRLAPAIRRFENTRDPFVLGQYLTDAAMSNSQAFADVTSTKPSIGQVDDQLSFFSRERFAIFKDSAELVNLHLVRCGLHLLGSHADDRHLCTT